MSDDNKIALNEEEEDVNYKAPAERSLEEIIAADQEDESLKKYKEALLGQATKGNVVVDESNPNRVLVKSLTLLSPGRPDIILNLGKTFE